MTKRYNHRGLEHNAPAPGGMGACRPTAFDGGKAEIGGLFGRLIAAPTPAAFGGLPCTRGQRADVGIGPYEKAGGGSVGADYISARDAPPEPPWPSVIAARSWRHVGMPPYGVRRG